jgi:hypothetical protein
MTKKDTIAILITVAGICFAAAQDSPSPSPAPEQSPSPSPSVSAARSVELRFVPPPMEGTISLGIFDSNDKLVRVLHRQSTIDNFTIDENSLNTTWDGKNDAGEDSPVGKYRARGYMVAHFKVDNLGAAAVPTEASDHALVKLVTNPLVSDTRSVLDVTIGLDEKGSFLKTTDGLPLFSVDGAPNLIRAAMTKTGDKSIDVWEDRGTGCEHLRVSNIDKIMAFDCGYFELK